MKFMEALHLYRHAQVLLPRGPILGLRVGKTHVGVATSDNNLKLASPLCFLHNTPHNITVMASEINDMIKELNARALVIGYPYLRGKINPNAYHVFDFVDPLNGTKMLDEVPYTWWDDSYTTVLYDHMVSSVKLGPLDKPYREMFAAVEVLQGCLDAMVKT